MAKFNRTRAGHEEFLRRPRVSRILVLALSFMCISAMAMHGQAGEHGALTVIVSRDRVPIAGARVTVTETNPAGKAKANSMVIDATTDASGRAFVDLPPGLYHVTAASRGWEPASGRVTIAEGQHKPVQIRLVLRYPDCRVVKCEL